MGFVPTGNLWQDGLQGGFPTKTIKNGSVITWQHINLQGEYDFSEENLENPIEFQLPELLDLQVFQNGKWNFGVKPWVY